MTGYRSKGAVVTAGPKAALRQSGVWLLHPEECECRKCRRAAVARARRKYPRYGIRSNRK